MDSESGVEFRDVSFGRPGQPDIVVDFSLTVRRGDVLALVGTSGAGKTTILKLINRLLVPSRGEVFVEGRETRLWDAIRLRRAVGYVIQEIGLFPHLSVADNIAVVPRLEQWPEERVVGRVGELLALVELAAGDYAQRGPDELSGGQRQRVGVARALAADPPVLLMDEPFGALDPLTRRQLQQQFSDIQKRLRKTVILVTHDMTEAMRLADRIGVMEQGRLVWCGEPQAIADAGHPLVSRLVDAATPPQLHAGSRPA